MAYRAKKDKYTYTDEQIEMLNRSTKYVFRTYMALPDCQVKRDNEADLISAGFDGLCSAVQLWDQNKERTFMSFCILCIDTAMRRKMSRIIKTQFPTIDIDAIIPNEEGDGRTLAEILADPNENVEERGLIKAEADELLDIIYKVCNNQEIQVIELYCNKGLNYLEIAKEMNLSRQRIHQIIQSVRNKVLKKYKIDP